MKVHLRSHSYRYHFSTSPASATAVTPHQRRSLSSAVPLAHPSSSNGSTASASEDAAAIPVPTSGNARWLSDTKARIGKCVMFGLSKEQAAKSAAVCRALGEEWRDFVAGKEGFLVDRKRAGLLRHGVVWGEMDCMVRSPSNISRQP